MLWPEFCGIFLTDLGSWRGGGVGGGEEDLKMTSSENDQLTGHFQSVFFFFIFQSFFFLISPEQTVKVI